MTLQQLQVFLINMSSIITAGGIICAFALKIGKGILNKELEPFEKRIDEFNKKREEQHNETLSLIDDLKIELNNNSLNTMKNTICNEKIPLSERVSVGKEYLDKGGNGAVKVYLHQLEKRYERSIKNKGE